MKLQFRTVQAVSALVMLGFAACGDPDTTDGRGYTKAPLENPTVLIGGEEPGEMAEYGAPNRVVVTAIELPEQTDAPAQAAPSLASVELPAGVTMEMVEAGDEIFNSGSICYSCHGAQAAGGALAPALNDGDWIHIDGSFDAIAEIITTGVAAPQQFPAPMPAMGGSPLSEDQVRQLAAYIYAISR